MKDGNRAESKSNESPRKLDVPDMRKSSYSRRTDISSFFGENPFYFQIFKFSGHGASVHGKILSQCGIRHRNLYAAAVNLDGKVVQICQ